MESVRDLRDRAMPITAILIAAALGLGSCTNGAPEGGRVLLLGIDGATLHVTDPLQKQGRLPTLAALARQGTSGPLRSFLPLNSPAIWTSIATGKRRGKHGIASFVRSDKQGKNRLYQSTDRRTHALWNIASSAGLSVGVVNWWTTYPVEKVRGILVSDHAVPGQAEGYKALFNASGETGAQVVFPQRWGEKLSALLADDCNLTDIRDPFLGNEALPKWVARENLSNSFQRDDLITRIALEVESEIQPDLLMVFLPGIDRISHSLWGVLEPAHLYPPPYQPTDSEREAGREALYRYYEYTDALIGRLVERFGPEDLVMVVSDHGFEAGAGRRLTTTTGLHHSKRALFGVIFARGPGIPAGARAVAVSVLDITPSILRWLRLPVARDMDGAPARFLETPAVEPITTYDRSPIEHLGNGSSSREQEILEELRGLGYME